MRMVAQAEFSTTDVTVQPGETETFTLAILNLGNTTETFTFVPSGLLSGWVRIEPPTITLFGGSHEAIAVTLRPPRLASTPAGPAPLTVRIIPQDDPDEVVIAETTAVIGAFHDRHIHMLQPVVRSSRRANFEFLVDNQGNSQASCRLHLIDTSQRLDGDFDPPAVGVAPGENSLVRLKLKAIRRQWRRGSRILPFSIEADQQSFPTASADANFVQTPFFPEHLGRKFIAAAAVLGALAGAWFGLLKPLTERTARDAVDDNTATTIVTVPVVTAPGDTAPTTTQAPDVSAPVTVAPVAAADEGEPFTKFFQVSVDPEQTQPDSFTVPDGKVLRITTVVLQNAYRDGGLATFLKNDTVLYSWNLGLTLDNVDPLPLSSPIVFEAGAIAQFQVTCDTVGPDSPNQLCNDGLLINGILVDAG
jgi:hypothetical protein